MQQRKDWKVKKMIKQFMMNPPISILPYTLPPGALIFSAAAVRVVIPVDHRPPGS
jgi:hypothetical protein